MTNFKLVFRFSNFGIFIELFSPCYGLNRGHQYEFLVTKYKFKTKKIQSRKRNEKNFARLELFLFRREINFYSGIIFTFSVFISSVSVFISSVSMLFFFRKIQIIYTVEQRSYLLIDNCINFIKWCLTIYFLFDCI